MISEVAVANARHAKRNDLVDANVVVPRMTLACEGDVPALVSQLHVLVGGHDGIVVGVRQVLLVVVVVHVR